MSTPSGLQLRSKVERDGVIELSLVRVPTPEPKPDEVVVRVEAAPLNPSDLGLLLAGADASSFVRASSADGTVARGRVPDNALRALGPRLGEALPVGNEGAGVVVAAGSNAGAWLGKVVSLVGGATYAQYRCVHVAQCLRLPDGVTPAEGASWFVNPMTALGMIETMRAEGHGALVHTAAASNLGQMLHKVCAKDGIGLVNVVRKPEQAALLRSLGAQHVCDSSAPTFMNDLIEAIAATSATLAFDAVGGGTLASQILTAMEIVASRKAEGYSRYGSSTPKQVYIYGMLDRSPTVLHRSFGMTWGVGGWLLTPVLQKAGPETRERMRARVASELTTTFASRYVDTISLQQALEPDLIAAYGKQATGGKHLIAPQRGL